MPRIVSSLFNSGLAFFFWVIVLWGETVGNVHAFRQHGPNAGWDAVIMPPLAWYRGVEYFWHKSAPDIKASYPPFTADEQDVMSRVLSKALQQPLTDEDTLLYKHTVSSYCRRVGKPLSKQDYKDFLTLMRSTIDYKRELGKCLLLSIDQKQPFVSTELEVLQKIMRSTGMSPGRLERDLHEIDSAASQFPYTDEWGHEHDAITRDQVVNGLRMVDLSEENFKKLAIVLEESIALPKGSR